MTQDAEDNHGGYHAINLPGNHQEVRARHESNRAGWNEGAVRYSEEIEETITYLKSGHSNLHPIEKANLGSLQGWCKTAIHLQCASGRDTLSLLHEGAEQVVGVDISDVHIDNARKISNALNMPARWYRCDVLDTPHELDGWADLVYTGRGALCWLQDLTSWGIVVARLLKPGGIFHVLDDHPMTWLFDQDSSRLRYAGTPYFGYAESNVGWPTSYIGELEIPLEKQARKYERLWTLSDVFMALKSAGLEIEKLGEHVEPYWNSFPKLDQDQFGKIPLTFSLMARKQKL